VVREAAAVHDAARTARAALGGGEGIGSSGAGTEAARAVRAVRVAVVVSEAVMTPGASATAREAVRTE